MLLPSPQLLSLPLDDLISALFLKAVAQLRKLSIRSSPNSGTQYASPHFVSSSYLLMLVATWLDLLVLRLRALALLAKSVENWATLRLTVTIASIVRMWDVILLHA